MKKDEIERKFWLKRTPKVPSELLIDVLKIKQFYLRIGNTDNWERIRRSYSRKNDKTTYFYTMKKKISSIKNEEDERVLSKKSFDRYIKLCKSKSKEDTRVISKTRYVYKDGKLKWEVDVFKNMSMIIAEIEIPTENYKLTIPKFISNVLIMEVSEFSQVGNRTLAEKISTEETYF
jgi:CYTH domain-containing protein